MARPSKYNTDRVKPIIHAVEQGVPYRHACAIAGISEGTFARWRARYSDFDDAIKAAEGRAVAGRLARIRMAEDTSWQAAAWWLERKYPLEFGRKPDAQVNVTVNIRETAERIAAELGLDPADVVAEAEEIMRTARQVA